MMPPSDNRERQEVDRTAEKARHVFESTKTYLESTVAEARVIENKTRYLLILTLSVSFGLVGFLAVTVENPSFSAFLFDLAWVGGMLLLVLVIVSFILMWNLLPQHKVHHPGSEFRSFLKKGLLQESLGVIMLAESLENQARVSANIKLNERRGSRLKWSTYVVLVSLAVGLLMFLVLLRLKVA